MKTGDLINNDTSHDAKYPYDLISLTMAAWPKSSLDFPL